MGMNYYADTPVCPACGRSDERMHIGKSSAGWCFSLRVYPELGISTLADWYRLLEDGSRKIEDEYGSEVSWLDLHKRITNRSRPGAARPWTDKELAENSAVRGPANLARHKIDGRHCIGHGNGTYDFIVGEFS